MHCFEWEEELKLFLLGIFFVKYVQYFILFSPKILEQTATTIVVIEWSTKSIFTDSLAIKQSEIDGILNIIHQYTWCYYI